MPFNAFARHRPSRKAYHRRNSIPWLAMASDSRRATDECELPPLDIGVRAIQLSPYRVGVAGPCHTRLLTSPAFQPCCCSLALSGLGEAVASESSALNSGLLRRQFLPCVTWRTLSPHRGGSHPQKPMTGSIRLCGYSYRSVVYRYPAENSVAEKSGTRALFHHLCEAATP